MNQLDTQGLRWLKLSNVIFMRKLHETSYLNTHISYVMSVVYAAIQELILRWHTPLCDVSGDQWELRLAKVRVHKLTTRLISGLSYKIATLESELLCPFPECCDQHSEHLKHEHNVSKYHWSLVRLPIDLNHTAWFGIFNLVHTKQLVLIRYIK